jgi:type III secretion system YscQ/HrcQ family protein
MHGVSERRVPAVEDEPEHQTLASVLPSVEPAARDALNHWLKRRMTPTFPVGDSEYEVTWHAAAEPTWHVVVEVTAGAHRAWLALDGFAAIDPLMVGEPLTLMPAPLRQLVVQRMIARVLANAPRALAAAADVRAIHWNAPLNDAGACRLLFTLTRRADGVQSIGALLFETTAALEWLDQVLPVDDASRRSRASIRVPLQLRLGHSKLPMTELGELRRDDVVWIETASITRDGIAIELGTTDQECIWKGRARRHELRLVTAGVPTATAKEAARASVATTIKGAQVMSAERWRLDVPVTFELGTLNMKVDAIEQLQPGQIVDLPQDVATATVTLKVAGAPVAEGALIVVGKRLGVRIGRMLGSVE